MNILKKNVLFQALKGSGIFVFTCFEPARNNPLPFYKKMFSLNRLLLYFLVLPTFFLIGASITAWLGAGDGLGLPAGAVIVFYGALSGLSAFIASLFMARHSSDKTVWRANLILGVVLLAFALYLVLTYKTE